MPALGFTHTKLSGNRFSLIGGLCDLAIGCADVVLVSVSGAQAGTEQAMYLSKEIRRGEFVNGQGARLLYKWGGALLQRISGTMQHVASINGTDLAEPERRRGRAATNKSIHV